MPPHQKNKLPPKKHKQNDKKTPCSILRPTNSTSYHLMTIWCQQGLHVAIGYQNSLGIWILAPKWPPGGDFGTNVACTSSCDDLVPSWPPHDDLLPKWPPDDDLASRWRFGTNPKMPIWCQNELHVTILGPNGPRYYITTFSRRSGLHITISRQNHLVACPTCP